MKTEKKTSGGQLRNQNAKKDESEVKKIVPIRMTIKQKESIREAAKIAKLSPTEFMRRAIFDRVQNIRDSYLF